MGGIPSPLHYGGLRSGAWLGPVSPQTVRDSPALLWSPRFPEPVLTGEGLPQMVVVKAGKGFVPDPPVYSEPSVPGIRD